MNHYLSPRWTGEILDCSMPVTFDTYSHCSFNCMYCFSYFQKSHSMGERKGRTGDEEYQDFNVRWVDTDLIKRQWTLEEESQFSDYIRARKVMQWGGLADQFDEYERKHGKTLELMKLFKELDYPLSFSTKSVWWTADARYMDLVRHQDNWNCKFSIINLDPDKARQMEKGVPSPQARIEAIATYARENPRGGATLRLRPFIIGHTDRNNEHIDLIKMAYSAGARAVSTEFFCLERRADDRLKTRYNRMSEVIGFDIQEFYNKYSRGSGYLRLNYKIKEPFIKQMQETCDKLGMRFYVSDAHHKEKSCNGSCCGLPPEWNYSRGQFTEALLIAKERGRVYFSDIEPEMEVYKNLSWYYAQGFNTTSSVVRAQHKYQSMFDYMREIWNTPKSGKSPYKYFGGILKPVGVDDNGDVIYEFDYERAGIGQQS